MPRCQFTYSLSEQGRRAAIKAGLPGTQKQSFYAEISVENIDLCSIDNEGRVSLSIWYPEFGIVASAEDLILVARAKKTKEDQERAIEQKKKAEKEAKEAAKNQSAVDAFLADSSILPTLSNNNSETIYIPGHGSYFEKSDNPIYIEAVRRYEAAKSAVEQGFLNDPSARLAEEYPWYNSYGRGSFTYKEFKFDADSALYKEAKRRNLADHAAQAEADRQREQEKEAFLRNWVLENGSESQKERMEADLLPHNEIIAEIKAQVFEDLDNTQKAFKKIELHEVCDCYDREGCELECSSAVAEDATAEEWESLKEIKRILAGKGEVTLKHHECETSRCDQVLSRKGIQVKLKFGPFTFVKEYAV